MELEISQKNQQKLPELPIQLPQQQTPGMFLQQEVLHRQVLEIPFRQTLEALHQVALEV